MKKILILANNDIGLYKFRLELIQALLNENDVLICSPKGEYINTLQELGCKFIETPLDRRGTNPINDIKLFIKYRNIIKHEKPDIVLTFTIKPNIYGGLVCRILNVPYIVNITGLGTAVENKGLLQFITTNLYKISLNDAKVVFLQNQKNQQFFKEKKIALGKHKLIPGSGVNLERFPLLEYPADQVIRFVFISRIMKEKGIEQYLDAAKYIKKKYPNTEFHICGFCEEAYEDILNEYEEAGIVVYHGMVKDIVKVLKSMHCTIHPTYYPEGMSNVLLESAACGKPIITTNRNGCKEIVDNKLNGLLIEQENSQDLINKIELFLSLPKNEVKKMGITGRKKVEKEFDRKIVVDSYLKEIRKIKVR